jgi:integrase
LRGKNPKWIGRWREDVILESGEIRRIERSTVLGTKAEVPTQKLARRRLEAILARINAPDYRPGRFATLDEFADKWKELVLLQRKPSTVHAAKSHLAHHILPVLGRFGLDQIGREVQQEFAGHLCRKVSRKMALNVLGTLSSILRTAKSWGYVCECMDMGSLTLPSQAKTEAKMLSAKQAAAIIAAASSPYREMFAIAAMTGMRSGEIMALETGDVDFERRLIYVRRSSWRSRPQTTKSAASVAVLPMPEPLEKILREYLVGKPAGLLFPNSKGKPRDQEKIVRFHLRPLLDQLEIPHCGFHAFRHLHASLLLDVGASPKVAQAQLRHADARITVGIYAHVIGDSHREAVDKLAEVLRSSAPKLEPETQVIQ